MSKEVELKNIEKNYGDFKASDNVNLAVEKGRLIGLLGPSGSGKTTILRMIAGLEQPDKGDIFIAGQRVNDLPAGKRGIGFVFQNYALFNHMTVAENIAFGLQVQKADKKKIQQRTEMLAELVGLANFIHRYPMQLSGGQRQRVAIARAMLRNAPIVILDEATSALDNESEAIVQKAMDNLMQNRTVFIIAHRLSTIKNANRIAVINEGELVELGSHDELMNIPDGQYKALYEMQFKKQEIEV